MIGKDERSSELRFFRMINLQLKNEVENNDGIDNYKIFTAKDGSKVKYRLLTEQ